MDYMLYLGLGAVAGLLGGLFGMGGGAIIVPMLIFAFGMQGISPQVATHIAVATSLATIVLTSIPSIYTHTQKNAVRWDLVRWITPGIILGTLLGGLIALALSGTDLQLLLGCFLIVVGLQMLISLPQGQFRHQLRQPDLVLAGGGIGGLSAVFGIGGGSLTIPFLRYFGVGMHQAVGSSAACGFFIALFSTLLYSLSSSDTGHLPAATLGYIFIPAWLGIILTSVPFARIGALVAHRLNERLLSRLFGGLLIGVGTRFIWINLIQ